MLLEIKQKLSSYTEGCAGARGNFQQPVIDFGTAANIAADDSLCFSVALYTVYEGDI